MAKKRRGWQPSAPTMVSWVIAIILGAAGILGNQGIVAALSGISFWLVVAGWALFALATALEGL